MTQENSRVAEALEALRQGKFICVFDAEGREEETDLIIASQFVTPDSIKTLRTDGGGLVFMMVDNATREHLGLPFLSDVFYKEGNRYPVLKELIPNDIPYDVKSSFSITINHRNTFTGITDKDRALTVSEFAKIVEDIKGEPPIRAQRLFGQRFRAPGHIPLCVSSEKPLSNRFGHTELGIALVTMAGLVPTAAGCEMMTDLNALSKDEARKYAESKGLVFLEGKEVVEAWKKWQKSA